MVEQTRTYPLPPVAHITRYVEMVLLRTAWVSSLVAVVAGYLGFVHVDGAFELDPMAATAVTRYLDNWLLVTSLGGILGALLLAAPVNYLKRVLIRASLNRHAELAENRAQAPVAWQRSALEGKYVSGTLRFVGIALVLVFGVFLAASIALLAERRDIGIWAVLAATVVLTALGLVLTVLGFRKQKGQAVRIWAGTTPPRDPRERSRQLDGTRHPASLRELWRRTRRDRGLDMRSDGPLAEVTGIEQVTGWLRLGGHAALGLTVLSVVVPLALRQSCEDCDVRVYSPTTEALVDNLLRLGTLFLVLGLLALLAAAVCGMLSSLRLRRVTLELAAVPDAAEPPWPLLRRLLLEEVPHERILGSLHTWAVVALTISTAGLRTGPEHPLADWYQLFPALGTLGGVLLLFHVSGWFWHRSRTLAENAALLERWPGG